MRHRWPTARLVAVTLVLVILGIAAAWYFTSVRTEAEPEPLILASTTSPQDSGLLDVLIPAFQEEHPDYEVRVLSVGTGVALERGRRGNADVLLVHAKNDEDEFIARGFGIERRDVMYNDFVIVGPSGDPAGIAGIADASKALADIAAVGAPFVSRGDNSGTNTKELALWETAGLSVENAGGWYHAAGLGMGDSLRLASDQAAYILTDRGTYLANSESLALVLLVEGEEALRNQYGVVTVKAAANPEGGQAFADWIVGDEAQEIIGEFGVEDFDSPLFTPNASE